MAEKDKSAPPYIAFLTFKAKLKSLGESGAVPDRIDASVLGTMGGSARLQFLGALRFLHLIDDQSHPTETMKALATSSDADWPKYLSALVKNHYSNQLKSLATGTPQQLRESFGDDRQSIVAPAVRFLVAAAGEAGIAVGQHHKVKPGRTLGSGVKRRKRTPEDTVHTTKNSKKVRKIGDQPNHDTPAENPVIQSLIQKFPVFDPKWDAEQQKSWFSVYERLLNATAKKKGG